ncbi:MAG: type I-F CRISPR-associated endoribonuclease Cas6/Csy4 [Colwellia sp.]|jgi:CRISPR-associated protein, Csy4 family
MNHYIDIVLKPDAEMRENVLMNKVYTKLHKSLCDSNSNDIGISFPLWKVLFGRVLRLHGAKERLEVFQKADWLGGLAGYCGSADILSAPENIQHRMVSRIQTTMSPAKLERLIKRGSISESEVKAYKAKMFTKGLDNPYLELESTSNGLKYRRYICFGELKDQAVTGDFDSFGLSKVATVPWF